MSNFASVRNWLAVFGSTISAAILSLWLAWAEMSDHRLVAILCFWMALGWALGAGWGLFFAVRALDTFRLRGTATSNSPCSTLKFVLGGWVPVVASLAVISLWGAHFTLTADNLLVALVFATTASALLTVTSVCYAIWIWHYERANSGLASERTSAMRQVWLRFLSE